MELIKKNNTSEFEKENNEDLIVFMSMEKEDHEVANSAFSEFYSRHVRYIYFIINKHYANRLNDPDLVNILVQDTFLKAFKHAASYRPISRDQKDKEEQYIHAWLAQIAENLFFDTINIKNKSILSYHDEESLSEEYEKQFKYHSDNFFQSYPISEKTKIITEVLESLKERDRIIILTYFDYYEKDKYLPRDVMKELCETFNTTSDNVRLIKNRIIKEIKEKASLKKII